ncbi:MAG TPA: hypothetical protein VHL58_17860 [Thermoanaerobaculia bacterium]|nr:hypothetical protein [Thermoanaerobaculia bacterium]
MRGRITWSEPSGVILVVDGREITLKDLDRILSTNEGFVFELEIRDASD